MKKIRSISTRDNALKSTFSLVQTLLKENCKIDFKTNFDAGLQFIRSSGLSTRDFIDVAFFLTWCYRIRSTYIEGYSAAQKSKKTIKYRES